MFQRLMRPLAAVSMRGISSVSGRATRKSAHGFRRWAAVGLAGGSGSVILIWASQPAHCTDGSSKESTFLQETRTGLNVALSGDRRVAVSPVWNYALGGMGFLGGFQGTTAYIARVGSRYPVLAGLKTPWALFGAVLGGQLSYHLAPMMVDGARSFSQIVAFTADGLAADIFGRPRGQLPAWERGDWWASDNDLNPLPPDPKLEAKMARVIANEIIVDDTDSGQQIVTAPEDRDKEIRWMAGRLVEIRNRENGIIAAAKAAPYARARVQLLKDSEPELASLVAEKASLKQTALRQYNVKLGRYIHQDILKAVDELMQLRLKQYALGLELGEGSKTTRWKEIRKEISAIDKSKADLKRTVRATYGVKLGRRCKHVAKWTEARRASQ